MLMMIVSEGPIYPPPQERKSPLPKGEGTHYLSDDLIRTFLVKKCVADGEP